MILNALFILSIVANIVLSVVTNNNYAGVGWLVCLMLVTILISEK